jgi:hypothetical protein
MKWLTLVVALSFCGCAEERLTTRDDQEMCWSYTALAFDWVLWHSISCQPVKENLP